MLLIDYLLRIVLIIFTRVLVVLQSRSADYVVCSDLASDCNIVLQRFSKILHKTANSGSHVTSCTLPVHVRAQTEYGCAQTFPGN